MDSEYQYQYQYHRLNLHVVDSKNVWKKFQFWQTCTFLVKVVNHSLHVIIVRIHKMLISYIKLDHALYLINHGIHIATCKWPQSTYTYMILEKFLPRSHAQGVKQSVCQSVVIVVVSTKIASSWVLGNCACCKHNQSVDID